MASPFSRGASLTGAGARARRAAHLKRPEAVAVERHRRGARGAAGLGPCFRHDAVAAASDGPLDRALGRSCVARPAASARQQPSDKIRPPLSTGLWLLDSALTARLYDSRQAFERVSERRR